ncbi:MAG: hypothetical protein U0136_06020 [Bdellovibrionota bacterium]
MIIRANIVTAFNDSTIGTKVTDRKAFDTLLNAAVAGHDFTAEDASKGIVRGQGFVMLPAETIDFVVSGVGRHTHDPDDYVVRKHRGAVGLFLRRDKAEPATGVAAVVYTREAYLADPDVLQDSEELARVTASDASHVLVAVLAFAGPKATVGFERFVKNLAGGNNSYQPGNTTHEALVTEAQKVVEYHDTWCTVAD